MQREEAFPRRKGRDGPLGGSDNGWKWVNGLGLALAHRNL